MKKLETKIEAVLQNRIKHIGDNEQIYTGCPQDLIDELMASLTPLIEK